MSGDRNGELRTAPVRIRVPATSANLGPGFDSFGLALGLYNEVVARVAEDGLAVEVVGEGAETVRRDEHNLVVRAARAVFEHLGVRPRGLHLTCTNRIPHGRGLGSSAAAIVAGVIAARELVVGGREKLPDDEALRLAAQLEGHPDNVAACLLGGFTIVWEPQTAAPVGPRVLRLEPHPDLAAVAFISDQVAATAKTRRLLPERVPHRDAARSAAHAAVLVAAITGRPELLFDATVDFLHQPYRAPAMPESARLVDRLRAEGIPAVISGAGPTVLVLADRDRADEVAAHPAPGFTTRRLDVDLRGARPIPEADGGSPSERE
ncbi:MAG: homoserine kinase [Acidothermus sp.]|nr:homoserine kinase [Acidothermus sp.]MCL6537212.1 homoserine kinase [Acidothermus sp.]